MEQFARSDIAYDMAPLNEFELEILQHVAERYPSLATHVPYLRVTRRNITGVGMYIDFAYAEDIKDLAPIEVSDADLSARRHIKMEGLKHGMGHIVAIADRRISYVELFTYADGWDGVVRAYSFNSLD